MTKILKINNCMKCPYISWQPAGTSFAFCKLLKYFQNDDGEPEILKLNLEMIKITIPKWCPLPDDIKEI